MITAKDIKIAPSKKLYPGDVWRPVQLPNGNILHNVRRTSMSMGGMRVNYYESDNFAFGIRVNTMQQVKEHAAEYCNRQNLVF